MQDITKGWVVTDKVNQYARREENYIITYYTKHIPGEYALLGVYQCCINNVIIDYPCLKIETAFTEPYSKASAHGRYEKKDGEYLLLISSELRYNLWLKALRIEDSYVGLTVVPSNHNIIFDKSSKYYLWDVSLKLYDDKLYLVFNKNEVYEKYYLNIVIDKLCIYTNRSNIDSLVSEITTAINSVWDTTKK